MRNAVKQEGEVKDKKGLKNKKIEKKRESKREGTKET